jgi:hypothetical protein
MRCLISILFFLTLTSVFANSSASFDKYEEATIHFNDGTSVRGYGKIVDVFKIYKIKFKVTLDGKADVWDELMVKGLTLHRELFDIEFQYVSIVHKSKPALLEVIEQAEISAYAEVDSHWVDMNFGNNQSSNFSYAPNMVRQTSYKLFVKREETDKAFCFDGVINFKKEALKFFSNCPQIIEKIKKRQYKRHDVLNMVYYYNDYCAALD